MRSAIILILGCLFAAAEVSPGTKPAQTFVIGLSPYLDASVKDDVYRNLVRLVVEGLPLNSRLVIFDAYNLKSVTQVSVPDLRVFDSPKTRANQFAPAIRELKAFLAQHHAKPRQTSLKLDGAILLPQFCDFLAENLPAVHGPIGVMVVGSPLYQDSREPAFSMVDGYFPSDGHLLVSRDKSVFGMRQPPEDPVPLRVTWVYFGDPWVSDLHREKITRFWSLYLEGRGGRLATLSADLPTAIQAFGTGLNESPSVARRWELDREQTKIEMLRITREVPSTDWLTGEVASGGTPPTPVTMVGPMRIGIRWSRNLDLDLYATPHQGAETLFFQHPHSPEGYYYKDHRASPGKEWEFVEFTEPVDARQVEAFVNFYKGSCTGGPQGEVRIEFDGRIYSAPFSIKAEEGNLGRSGRLQQDFWTRIPVQQILRIGSAG